MKIRHEKRIEFWCEPKFMFVKKTSFLKKVKTRKPLYSCSRIRVGEGSTKEERNPKKRKIHKQLSKDRSHLQIGDWKLENGDWKLENGDRNPENGNQKLENGDWKPENGDRKPENGDRKPENRTPKARNSIGGAWYRTS